MPVVNLDESCVLHRWHVPTASQLFLSWMPGRWEKRCGGCFWMRQKICQSHMFLNGKKRQTPQLPERRNNKNPPMNSVQWLVTGATYIHVFMWEIRELRFPFVHVVGLPTKIFRASYLPSEIPPLFEQPSL